MENVNLLRLTAQTLKGLRLMLSRNVLTLSSGRKLLVSALSFFLLSLPRGYDRLKLNPLCNLVSPSHLDGPVQAMHNSVPAAFLLKLCLCRDTRQLLCKPKGPADIRARLSFEM